MKLNDEGEVFVVVTLGPDGIIDLEVLDARPKWTPETGQVCHVANVNGGDSVPTYFATRDGEVWGE